MKRLILPLFLICALSLGVLSAEAASTPKHRSATCLTGGTTGCLDKFPIVAANPDNNLVTGDAADVEVGGFRYFYRFDKSSTAATASPTYIRPVDYDTNGPGVWILSSSRMVSITTSPTSDPTLTFSDSDNAAGTAKIYANSSGGANDIIMYIGVEDSTGENTPYIEVDGVSETVDILKPLNVPSLVSTGPITGRALVVPDADGKTLSGQDMYGSLQLATGAGTWTIPDIDAAAGTGGGFCLRTTGVYEIVITPNAEDQIELAGTLLAAGVSITNNTAEATGNYICLLVTDFNGDIARIRDMGSRGTWTAVP